jgi:hypothetical protein
MKRWIVMGALAAVIAAAGGYVWLTPRAPQPSPAPAVTSSPPPVAEAAPVPEPSPEPEGPPPPSFDIVRINPKGGTVIAGRAEPGATVTVLSDGQPIGSAPSDGNGEWVLVLDHAIEPGSHALSLSAAAPGGTPLVSADSVVVVVPQASQDIAGQAAAETGQALALLVPHGDEAPIAVLQAPAGDGPNAAGPGELALDAVEYDDTGNVTVGGRAPAGAQLRVYVDNEFVGAGEAVAGRWAITPERALDSGEHGLRIDQVDEKGNVLARLEAPFARPESVILAQGQKLAVVQPGSSLWHIAFSTYGEGLRYAAIYAANQERITDPDVIFPGQVFILPADDD